ncbi:flagellar basal body rod protein FlgB [Marinicrinis lubricantis]|uniref:Flagellar basal body rod protein FlgB n=1 Tax=Marinicrinis lubricantis TaxID=2086470 RepID=A0ABW1IMI7_9BACL
MDMLQSKHLSLIESTINASAMRHKVIANNIANVDTPNFKRSEVLFEELLNQEMNGESSLVGTRTHSKHLPIGPGQPYGIEATIRVDGSTSLNNNQNNVDIDYEMALSAKNQLKYNALIQQMNHELKMFRTSIGGR